MKTETDDPKTPGDEPTAADLLAAFRELHPDPTAFKAGVRERIDEFEDGAESRATRFAAAPERMKWAASILPPGLVMGAVSLTGKAASFTGKGVLLKATAGVLALPSLSLLMLLGAFTGGVRSLRSAAAEPQDGEGDAAKLTSAWWQRNRYYALAAGVVVALLVLLQSAEVFAIFIGLSMACTVLLLGELSRAGLAERQEVAKVCARLLGGAAFFWFYLSDSLPVDPSGAPSWTGPLVLVLGALACTFASGLVTWRSIWTRIWHPELRMLYPDAITTTCLRVMYSFIALVGVILVILALAKTAERMLQPEPSRAGFVEYIAEFDGALDDSAAWSSLAMVVYALDEASEAPLDLTALRGFVQSELARGAQVDVLQAGPLMLELGLADPEQLPEVVSAIRGRSDGLRRSRYSLKPVSSFDRAAVCALAAIGGIDDEGRQRLTTVAGTNWPPADRYRVSKEIVDRIYILDALGQGELVDARRDYVHRSLLAHWRGLDPGTSAATFAQEPSPKTRRFGWSTLLEDDYGPTQEALVLMARLGVPEEIDLERVRATLRLGRARNQSPFPSAGYRSIELRASVALMQIEALSPEQHSFLSDLLAHRSILATILFSLLCLFATRRAPLTGELA